MIAVKSFISVGSSYVDIEDYCGTPQDPNYIEGYIYLKINEIILMDEGMSDLVDQLWAYLVDGLGKLNQGHSFETYFPDQPLRIVFQYDSRTELIKVVVHGRKQKSAVVRRSELLHVLTNSACRFFEIMLSRVPQKRAAYQESLAAISDLKT